MNRTIITESITLPSGQEIILESGKLAEQADGSVVVKCGETFLLATVVANKDAKDGIDFMPLTVDYREKYASTGKFPGGFLKREARPSDYEILNSRLIDRALRPLFPDDFHGDTQVLVSLISSDKDVMPDSMACLAASAALAVSDIPVTDICSEVRVARIDGAWIINPTLTQMNSGGMDIDLIVAGTLENIMMVEGEMKEVGEDDMIEAIGQAHEAIKVQCTALRNMEAKAGKKEKREYSHETHNEEFYAKMEKETYDALYAVAKEGIANKKIRGEKSSAIKDEFLSQYSEEELKELEPFVRGYFGKVKKKASRNAVLDTKVRLDGRNPDEIRPIWSEVDYLPKTHGSAIFTRGETQSLTSVTLGTKMDTQLIDGAFFEGHESLLLHYNFPPFSTGEARPMRGTSRREVGHGNLALRALKPMIPADCPYTIRIVSDILESNGSSSMATVCAGALALMDAGVKLQKPVSGIAMGLITDDSGNYVVLSDILGDEDHLGDMDFKVTGTRDGITACQMDIKVDGLSHEVLSKALNQAKAGRLHILDKIDETLSAPREDYKPHVPRIEMLEIDKDDIGAVIGPGGKVIQEMQADTGTTIVIEEVDGKGVIQVSGPDKASIEAALAIINGITAKPEIGAVYNGKVKSVVSFGAFVEILPKQEGLLHISEIEWRRLDNVESVLKVGDEVKVKLLAKDPKSGKLKLSRKALLPKPEPAQPQN
jgi:polyribonucleotide nucleotidyltransferase